MSFWLVIKQAFVHKQLAKTTLDENWIINFCFHPKYFILLLGSENNEYGFLNVVQDMNMGL